MGAMPRSYQVTPVGPSHLASAQRTIANPKVTVSVGAKHQVGRPNHRTSGTSTMTLSSLYAKCGVSVYRLARSREKN